MAKITQVQVWIIGVILSIIAGVGVYFGLIKPNQELLDQATQKYDAAHTIALTENEKKKDQLKAKQEVAEAQRDWTNYDRRLMPDIDVRNLLTGIQQLWNEQVQVLGPKVEKYLKADNKVRIVQAAVKLDPPPTDPNAVARPVFTYDLGTVSVRGTFDNVLNHVKRWNKFDRLVLTDGLTLSGNSPNLVGTYSMRCFVFTHNFDKKGPSIPQAAGGTGFGGGGGGVGGGPGGYGGDAFSGGGAGAASFGPPPGAGGYGGGYGSP